LADDEPDILFLVTDLLESNLECEIKTAVNGNEAFYIASKELFDIIITDHRMPESTGADFINEIRENQWSNHQTPVILLSAYGEEAKLILARLDNVFFLDKNKYFEKLVPYVKMILKSKNLASSPITMPNSKSTNVK
ncbi:MAG: response regulator, partial [Oligoflexia bacterium]|nr:response regulator [Oligoflexia bacterium]